MNHADAVMAAIESVMLYWYNRTKAEIVERLFDGLHTSYIQERIERANAGNLVTFYGSLDTSHKSIFVANAMHEYGEEADKKVNG